MAHDFTSDHPLSLIEDNYFIKLPDTLNIYVDSFLNPVWALLRCASFVQLR